MKKIIALSLAAIMLFLTIPFVANAYIVGDWEVEISNNKAALIGYHGVCVDKMVLPSYVGNYEVEGINGTLFEDEVKEIVVPEGYKFIGKSRLVKDDVKEALEKVVLPESLERFETDFNGYTGLKEINIPSKIKEIPDDFPGIFSVCKNLETVKLSEGLEKIGENAFSSCAKLKNINLPSTLKSIGKRAFWGCSSLEHIVIPDSVTALGDSSGAVFYGCENLKTVIVGDGVTTLNSYDYYSNLGEFSNCPNLVSIVLGKGIKSLQAYNHPHAESYGVLGGATSLKTLILPDGLEEIQQLSFNDCENLEALVIPKSVTTIGTYLKRSGFNNKYNYVGKSVKTKKPNPKMVVYGYAGSKANSFANEEGFPFVDISVATPTDSRVVVNGKTISCTAYNIGGNNYFKLRDIAFAINGTKKNFDVNWDGNYNAISLTRKKAYTSVGGELNVNTFATQMEPKISNSKIFVDGELTTFMAFSINNNNYFKLRDLGKVFDFAVEWDGNTQTITINTDKTYSE